MGDVLDLKRADDHGMQLWIADPKAGGGFYVPVSKRLRRALDAMPHRQGFRRKLTNSQVEEILAKLSAEPTANRSAIARSYGVSETAIRKLERQPLPASEYLFTRRRRAQESHRVSGVRQMLERYCRLANVPFGRATGGITWHWATRRTGASRMLRNNWPVGTVQKIGRWKHPGVVLSIYDELVDEDAAAAVESIGRRTPPSRGAKP